MASKQPPRSVLELDFLRRMQVRNESYAGVPFLTDSDADALDQLLTDAVQQGAKPKILRRAHDFLVLLQEKDEDLGFLDDRDRSKRTERDELTRLINPDAAAPAPPVAKPSRQPAAATQAMGVGEVVGMGSVVLAVGASTVLAYQTPAIADVSLWIGFWGVVFGGGFIRDARQRSVHQRMSISGGEGALVALVWTLATTVVILLGGDMDGGDNAATIAFFSFLAAAGVSRRITDLQDEGDF